MNLLVLKNNKIINFFENSKSENLGIYFSCIFHLLLLIFAIGLPNFFEPKPVIVPTIIPIEIINPQILLLLGSTALNTLIGDNEVISKARGKWIQKDIGNVKPWTIVSFHPAFIMRQPEQKKWSWIDLKMIRDKAKSLKI